MPLLSRLLSEFIGAMVLLAAVVGSGIAAARLSEDVGLQLLVNAVATVAALGVAIAVLGPISGAHFNPAVSLAQAVRGELPWPSVPAYLAAQVSGALAGTALANVMFDLPAWHLAATERGGRGQWLGEVVATAGLLMVVGFVSRAAHRDRAPLLVPAWILAAYFFTSSTSFANPAVTIARGASDTFAGIAPPAIPAFLLAQALGLLLGLGAMALVAPRPGSPLSPQARPVPPDLLESENR
jgi:glycerol uptake facilitator-like aquaporin